jgi:hypothetical protein
MLLDRASELVAEIEQFEKLRESAKEAQALEARAKQFAPVADKLSRAAETLTNIRIAGISIDFVPKEGDVLGKRAADLLIGFRSDPNSLASPEVDLKYQFVDRLMSLASAVENAALAGWKKYVSENSDPAGEEILAALSAVPAYRGVVLRIKAIQSRILLLSNAAPHDPKAAIEELGLLVAEYRTAWNEMTAGGIPQAVIGFLRACSLDGAGLDAYGEEVKAWLAERGLTHLFSIKIR